MREKEEEELARVNVQSQVRSIGSTAKTAIGDAPTTATPGPWRARGGDVYGAGVMVATAPSMARQPGSTIRNEQANANARLIAAAPDLLEALKGVLAGFDANVWCRNTDGDGDPAWAIKLIPHLNALALATTAIARAEGVQS